MEKRRRKRKKKKKKEDEQEVRRKEREEMGDKRRGRRTRDERGAGSTRMNWPLWPLPTSAPPGQPRMGR